MLPPGRGHKKRHLKRGICQPDDRQTLRIRPLRTDLVGRSSLRSSQPGTRAPSRSGFVITVLLSAAPGSSPFRRIPETNRQLTTWCRRMQAVCKIGVKFLPPRHYHRRIRSETRCCRRKGSAHKRVVAYRHSRRVPHRNTPLHHQPRQYPANGHKPPPQQFVKSNLPVYTKTLPA